MGVTKILIAAVLAVLSLSCGVLANRELLEDATKDRSDKDSGDVRDNWSNDKIEELNDGHWYKCDARNVRIPEGELRFLRCQCPKRFYVISIACYANDNRDIVMAATGFGLPHRGNTRVGWCDFKNLGRKDVKEDLETFVYCVK